MNKNDLIKKIAQNSCVTQKEAKEMLSSLCFLIKDSLKNGEDVKINGFGKFEVKNRSERVVMNPKTKERIIIPSSKRASFKASEDLTSAVN